MREGQTSGCQAPGGRTPDIGRSGFDCQDLLCLLRHGSQWRTLAGCKGACQVGSADSFGGRGSDRELAPRETRVRYGVCEHGRGSCRGNAAHDIPGAGRQRAGTVGAPGALDAFYEQAAAKRSEPHGGRAGGPQGSGRRPTGVGGGGRPADVAPGASERRGGTEAADRRSLPYISQ